jgi:hypothetical protein
MESRTSDTPGFTAFRDHAQMATGGLFELATTLRATGDAAGILVFDDGDGRQVDIDPSGSDEDLARRFGPASSETGRATPRRPGRPKLGVVGREVTLLPRHWAWLRTQRGGPSATLRRLVDEARANHGDHDRVRHAQDSINRFVSAIAGNLPGFEEATRALYRSDRDRFEIEISGWPGDLRRYIEHWSASAFGSIQDPSV